MPSRILQVVAMLCISTAALSAQSATAPASGTRVRVNAKAAAIRNMTGTIQAPHGDSLVIRPDNRDTSVVIPMMLVQRVEVSRGVRRHVARGLGYGFLTGGALGVVLGLATRPPENNFLISSRSEQAVVGGIYLGVLGGVIGLVVGASSKTEDWTVTMGDARLRISATSTGSGTGFGGRLTF